MSGRRVFEVIPPEKPYANDFGLIDSDWHIQLGYDIHDDAIVLVRPDGYVGFVANDTTADQVNSYLATMLGSRNSRQD